MSLVGTRPPTVDEWDKYELHHRARLATKPGLTGMWQVSGRSNITDFEEVVKLDKQYISEWTIVLFACIFLGISRTLVTSCWHIQIAFGIWLIIMFINSILSRSIIEYVYNTSFWKV